MQPRTRSWFIGRMLIHEMDDRMAVLLNLDVYASDCEHPRDDECTFRSAIHCANGETLDAHLGNGALTSSLIGVKEIELL